MTAVNLLSTYMEPDVVKLQDLKQEQSILHYFLFLFLFQITCQCAVFLSSYFSLVEVLAEMCTSKKCFI